MPEVDPSADASMVMRCSERIVELCGRNIHTSRRKHRRKFEFVFRHTLYHDSTIHGELAGRENHGSCCTATSPFTADTNTNENSTREQQSRYALFAHQASLTKKLSHGSDRRVVLVSGRQRLN